MDDWNPLKEDFVDEQFNSYIRGPARGLVSRGPFTKGGQRHIQLYVTGIPEELQETGLINLFSRYGLVIRAKKVRSTRGTGDTYGFVTMANLTDAERAIRELDKFQIDRFMLRVKVALSEEERKKRKEQKKFEDSLLDMDNMDDSDSDENSEMPKTNGFGPPKEPVKARHTVGRGQYLKGVNTDGLLPTPGQPGSYPYQVGPSGDNTSRGPLFTSTPSPSSNLFIDTNSLNPVGSGYHSDIPSSGQYHHHTPKGRGSGTGTNRYEDNQLAGGFMSDHPQSSINYGLPMGRGAGLNYNQMAAGHNHGRRGGGRGRGWNNRFMGRGGRRGGGRGRGFQMAYPPPFYAPGMLYVDPYGIMAPAMAPHLLQPAYQAYQNPALMSQPPAPAKQQTTKEPEEKGLTQECSVCSTLGSHRCSRCKTPYCSAKCQSQDWPQHKGICKNIAREREQMEDFESRFDVSVGEDLIPQVKSLMESYIKEPIEITRKKDYKQLTKKSVNNDDANSTSSSSKRTAAEQETASSKIPSNSELQRTNQSETAGNESSKGKACFNCGSMDHMRNECPKPANFNLRCYNCNNVGHVSKDCPEKGMVCYNCQATGHLSRNCPGKGGQKKGGKGNKDSKRKSGSSPTSPSAQGSKMNQSGSRNKGQQQSLSDSPVNNVEKVCPAVRKSSSPVPPQSRVIAKIPPKKKLTAAGMKVGDQVEVVITMVVSPAEICVQIIHTENILALSNIMQAMAKKYPNSACDVASVMVGEFYAAQFSQDQKWYRAQVLSYHGNDIVIKFVDFGNQETTSIEQLRQLDSSMTSHPTQAVLCCLDNIQPVSGDAWHVPHEQLIALLTPDNVTYTAECCRVIESATFNSHVVRLTNTKGEDMGSKLIQAGLAARKTALADDGNQQRTGLPAAGPQLVRDVPLVISQLRVGEEIPALITDKSSPTSFTIQVPHIQSIQEFLEFNAKFNQICVNDKTSQYRPQQVGELVASLFSGDEGWYRGEVLQILDTAAAIKFLDYGNSETVPFISLRKAHPFCSSLPLQGVTCRLANINTPPCGWPEGTEQLLDVHCAGPVTGVIKEIQDTTALVELRTMSGELLSDVIKTFLQSRGSEMVKNYRHPSDEDGISSTESVKTDKSQRHSSSQCLESTKLPLDGTKISSLIVDVVSVDMFHIQQACEDLQIQLGGMMAKLNEVCSSAIPCDVKVGNYVAAQYSDGESTLWYRAQVVSKSTDKLTVFFVDYGNTDSVARDAVTQLDVQFMDVPAMAVCCSLVGSERVVSDSLAQLKQLMNVVVQVEAVKCEQGKHLVNLYHEGSLINSAICLPSQVQPVQTLSEVKPQAQQEVIAATELPLDNTKVSAVIMDVTSLDRFHIQEASEDAQTKLAGMMAKLNQACGSATPCDVEVGNYVAAQYSDGESTLWYRAQVVSKSTDKLTVFFVDYGNTDSVARDAVTQLDVQFMDVPAMAVCCSLVGSERVVNDSLAQFKQLMNVVVQVEAVKCERGKHLVNLYHEGSLMNSVICLPSQVQHFQTLSEVKPQAQQDDVINEETSLFSFTKSVKKTVLNKAIATTELPLDGTKVSAVLMDVTSLNNFHIQQASEDAQTKLASMMTNLNQACASATPCDVEVGNYVAAQYSDGESTLWYRAQVVSKSTDKLTVFFVDYGNTDSVARDAVTQLNAQFMDVPAMAVCCSLVGSERVVRDGLLLLKQLMNVIVQVEAVKCERGKHLVHLYHEGSLMNWAMCVPCKDKPAQTLKSEPGLAFEAKPSGKQVPETSQGTALFSLTDSVNKTVTENAIAATKFPLDGTKISVIITDVTSLDNFHTQQASEDAQTKLASMMTNLNQACASATPCDVEVGSYVATQYSDGESTLWYRAQVVSKSTDKLTVFFVDYGNTDFVARDAVTQLDVQFMDVPAMAVCCSLVGSERVVNDSLAQLKQLMNVIVQVEAVTYERGKHLVNLYHEGSLINSVICLPSQVQHFQTLSEVKPQAQQDDVINEETSLFSFTKSVKKTVLNKVIATTELPLDGTKVSAVLMDVTSLDNFHIQQASEDAQTKLTSMMTNLNQACASATPCDVEVGNYVAAQYSDGESTLWYRAQVVSKSTDKLTVFFVDYGNTDSVARDAVTQLDAQFMAVPAMAVCCRLLGSERVVNDDGLAQLKQLMNVFVEVEAVKCEQDRFVVKIYQNQDLLNNTLCPEVTAVVVDETLPYVKSPSVPARSVNMINIQPTELIPDGSRVQSAPVFIESPSSFYIQLTNEEKKLSLAKMMQELNEHCIADSSHYEPVLGENVAAVFIENGQPTGWYRARVQDIKSNSEICVFFVDYGNTETLSVMGIRELPQSFFSLPAFGVHCRLLGGEMANEEAKSEMKVLINHELFTETVKREGDIHTVKLYLTDPNQTCVNTILNLDMFSKTCSEQLQVDVLQSKQEDQASSCTALVDSLPKPPITPPSDILPIRKSTSPIFVERKPVFVTTLHKNRPEKKEFKAIITSVVRPNLFHCQLFEDPAILQELKSLSDTMKVECETSQPTNLNLEQGELCCAYFPDDGKWYRGMVQEIFPDNTAKVWYVDFGNEADVPLNMLRPASEHYTQLPLQAFQCSLHGVIPVDGGWTAAARTKLSEFIRKPLMASVVEEDRDTYSVEMVTTSGDNIGDILIEAGLAKPAQAHGLDEKDLLLKQKELLEQQVKMLEAKLAAAGHT